MYKASVLVKRRPSILDPQGKGAEQGAKLLGFENISNVRINKDITFFVDTTDLALAESEVKSFCEKLLANPIIEDFEFTVVPYEKD